MNTEYTYSADASLPTGRRKLAAVIRAAHDVIEINDVVATLTIGRPKPPNCWPDGLVRAGCGVSVQVPTSLCLWIRSTANMCLRIPGCLFLLFMLRPI